ncbi:MAG: MarR family transcriptional regulator [Burkholderiales bacterium]|nr:MarR family transcriptional regulator [Burkholderiales bacterium]
MRLGKAYNAATQAFEALTGVGAARWRLLYLVHQQPQVSQKQLIRQVRVDPGAITRQLKALEQDGLISRSDDPRDTRLTRVRLTRSGQTLVRRVMRLRADFLERMVAGIPRADVFTCLDVLERISRNLGDDEPLPAPRPAPARARTPAGRTRHRPNPTKEAA